ncbi:MAG: 1-acyl-sn-glycerol-3-phosphate acyltransferase [Spirochaetales bacterium]|nr:1-acyl-sn-glycerol-3-phosphate acyltransferase [Spirochaetales bacterium]
MKNGQPVIRESRLYPFLKATVGGAFVRRFKVTMEGKEILARYTPPYIVLPNHVMFSDPFIIATLLRHPISWVTSDTQFRSRFSRLFLTLVGAIPKTKFRSDLESVKHIMKRLKSGGVVGIYPEGRRNWDGHTTPLLYATAKLLKVLKVPVVVPLVKGGYLAEPRWSRKRRKGRVIIEFTEGFSTEELKNLSVDQIFDKMNRLLEYDEYDYLKKNPLVVEGKRLAENLELALFICPHCKSIAKLESHFSLFTCTACGYAVHLNRYGFFEKRSEELYFETIREWNKWQLAYLKGLLEEGEKKDQPVFEDSRVWLMQGKRNKPFKKMHFGTLSIFADRLQLSSLKGDLLVFPMDEIQSINVQSGERLEFFHQGKLLRFRFLNTLVSAYKWLAAVLLMQGKFTVPEDTYPVPGKTG